MTRNVIRTARPLIIRVGMIRNALKWSLTRQNGWLCAASPSRLPAWGPHVGMTRNVVRTALYFLLKYSCYIYPQRPDNL